MRAMGMRGSTYKSYSVLVASTVAFTVCFMVWMMYAVLGIPVKKELGLNELQFGILTAIPVLSGSLVRVPLGIWTDRFGGRLVMSCLMLSTVVPIFMAQFATVYWQFLVIGLFVGLAGGSFSVGTPYVARWFSRDQQGLAMGVFGAGNAGASFSYSNPAHLVVKKVPLSEQIALMKNPAVLRYCQYYSVVFGGYVGLSLWMIHYYMEEYGFSMTSAAFLAACFSLPGGVLRAFGGYLSDKFGATRVTWGVMWVCWVAFFIL